MHRARLVALCGAAAALLAGCTASASASDPTWQPSPDFGTNGEGPGVELTPIIPRPAPSTRGNGSGVVPLPGATDPAQPGTPVVATHLNSPVGLTMMPDGTALVGERTTGRIVRVQPRPDQPVPTVRTLTGLDTSGDGGLLDLALSPTYDQDNLIYAYVTTRTDNRVIDFTLTGPATPVLTGIPKGRTGNIGRITFGADGNLYVGTGDAGKPSLAADPKSLAGKVLRVTGIGAAAAGNPGRSRVWTSGHHEVDGLCTPARSDMVLDVEPGGYGRPDEVNVLSGGSNYGWPSARAGTQGPAATLPSDAAAPGDCAIRGTTIWITSLDGHALLSARLVTSGAHVAIGKFATPALRNKYGRLKTVVAAPDGALWLTTSNRDGRGTPVPDDDRVIRYVPVAGGGGASPL